MVRTSIIRRCIASLVLALALLISPALMPAVTSAQPAAGSSSTGAQSELPTVVGIANERMWKSKGGSTGRCTNVCIRPENHLFVILDSPLPADTAPSVKINQVPVTVLRQAGGSLEFRIPNELIPANNIADYPVDVYAADKKLGGFCTVSVCPAQEAKVSDFYPKTIRDGDRIKIIGEGLFGPPEQIIFVLGGVKAKIESVDSHGKWINASIPNAEGSGWPKYLSGISPDKPTILAIDGVSAELLASGFNLHRSLHFWWVIIIFSGSFAIVGAIIAGIGYIGRRRSDARSPWLNIFFLDEKTSSYSLSKLQFFWWMLIIFSCYLFLFAATGILENKWALPEISGTAAAFFISLGTLFGAQLTTAVKGDKGSGNAGPQLSDFVRQGNVLAPDRVQQLFISLLIGGAFIYIVFKSYDSSAQLPAIPESILILMGISSAGYIGSKAVRGAGPIIKQVQLSDDLKELNESDSLFPDASTHIFLAIHGEGFSSDSRVVWDEKQPPDKKTRNEVLAEHIRPSQPQNGGSGLYGELMVALPKKPLEEWVNQFDSLTVINKDNQESVWNAKFKFLPDKDGKKAVSNTVQGG